ncbi:MAG: galactosyldiacylglycerol synthase, partial [Alphaproteobacteria bacterium]|nr:galactosyldiacylglycerol synthase [Alphaproteobacteria bacterium]
MQLDLIYFDAGGGHRASATALKAVIEQQGRPWTVRMVNLREIIDPTDRFRRTVGMGVEEGYNRFIAKGWTWGAPAGLKMLQGSIALARKPMVRRLAQYWAHTKPDMVVSLVPNFDRALYEGLKTAAPHVPFVTLLTDFADNPPHFWIEKGQKQSFICGTEKAVQQVRRLGHADAQIYPTSGMIIRPKFYDPITVERVVERQKLGLDPTAPTGLVLFGGSGAKVMASIAKRLGDTQLILICGNNAVLADKLRGMPSKAPHHIVGFTAEVPYYMHLADFFIGKVHVI